MDSSFWFDYDTINWGWSIVYRGVTGDTFQIIFFFISPKIIFVLANSVDPDTNFIWVFTVCQRMHLEAISIQRVEIYISIRIEMTKLIKWSTKPYCMNCDLS